MAISKTAQPQFNPYGDDDPLPGAAQGPWTAPVVTAPLAATLRLPGSKSLTNRELVLAALAGAPSTLRAPLHSRDSALMIEALRTLGVGITEVPGSGEYGPDLVVTPAELVGGSIDCGLAGTVMRFLPPVAALALGPVAFDGDEAARRRPMRTTIDSLRALGVDVSDDGRGSLPFSLYGTGEVRGGDLEIDASASSQFVSGLLLAAPRFTEGLRLRHTGERLPSLPHIQMTIAALAARGIVVENPEPGVWIVPPGEIGAVDVDIEPDLSNAAPFLVAALVAGGSVTIEGWPAATTQVGADLETLLPLFGATVTRGAASLTVTGGNTITGVDLDLSAGGELATARAASPASATSAGTRPTVSRPLPRRSTTSAVPSPSSRTASRSSLVPYTRAPGAATRITGWRPPARSSGSPCPASRSTTSALRRRPCRSSRSCGRRCCTVTSRAWSRSTYCELAHR
jgi:3-phosphoshikimate 1-carboxyvinyltransferase